MPHGADGRTPPGGYADGTRILSGLAKDLAAVDVHRADAEAAEQDAATAALRERDLSETITQAALHSSRLRLMFEDEEVHGRVMGIGTDLLSVLVREVRFDIRLETVRMFEPLPGAGPMVGISAASFVGRLRELEAHKHPVVINLRGGHQEHGVIRAVARDHAIVRENQRAIAIPFSAITHVLSRRKNV